MNWFMRCAASTFLTKQEWDTLFQHAANAKVPGKPYTWLHRNRAGRPKVDRGLRDLIRRMSREYPYGVRPGSMANC